jgi:hypothetical protein
LKATPISKLSKYLSHSPLFASVALILVLTAVIIWRLIPRSRHLDTSLSILPVWLIVGQLPGLPIYGVAKASSSLPFMLVGWTALKDREPKRRLHAVVFGYPALAVAAIIFVITTTDATTSLLIRLQWIVLVSAALIVGRLCRDYASVTRVLYALTRGLVVASGMLASSLLVSRNSVQRGFGRWEPWGSNPNIISTTIALTASFAFYLAIVTKRRLWGVVGAVSLGLLLITGSRGGLIACAIGLLPVLLRASRKPLLVVATIALAVVSIYGLLGLTSGAIRYDRVASLTTGRVGIATYYVDIIQHRPLTGLLLTTGKATRQADGTSFYAHDAYLDLAYVGGLALAGPTIVLICAAGICGVRMRKRWRRPDAPQGSGLMASMCLALFVGMAAHGFTSTMIFYPTYTWAFLFVLLGVVFIQNGRASGARLPASLSLPI